MLNGYKTYIVAAAMVICITAEVVLGVDVPGYEPGPDWLGDLLTAIGLGTLRHGIAAARIGTMLRCPPAVLAAAFALSAAVMLSPAPAEARPCGPIASVEATLTTTFGERQVFGGLAGEAMVTLWVAPSGNWTVLVQSAAGLACILAAGEAGTLAPRAVAPAGVPG